MAHLNEVSKFSSLPLQDNLELSLLRLQCADGLNVRLCLAVEFHPLLFEVVLLLLQPISKIVDLVITVKLNVLFRLGRNFSFQDVSAQTFPECLQFTEAYRSL